MKNEGEFFRHGSAELELNTPFQNPGSATAMSSVLGSAAPLPLDLRFPVGSREFQSTFRLRVTADCLGQRSVSDARPLVLDDSLPLSQLDFDGAHNEGLFATGARRHRPISYQIIPNHGAGTEFWNEQT